MAWRYPLGIVVGFYVQEHAQPRVLHVGIRFMVGPLVLAGPEAPFHRGVVIAVCGAALRPCRCRERVFRAWAAWRTPYPTQ
jgi:hypothetical protein